MLAGELAGIPPQHAVLVERYLDGPEFSVETFGDPGGRHHRQAPRGRHRTSSRSGTTFRPALPGRRGPRSPRPPLQALAALGLGWGPAHVELRLTATGPAVIEVNPRLAGGMIPDLVRSATGIDLIAATVANGGRPAGAAGTPSRAAGAAIRFLVAERSGRFVAARPGPGRGLPAGAATWC